jgi:hypothetical protein
MDRKISLITGTILVLLGIVMYAIKYFDFGFDIGIHWPTILCLFGAVFLIAFFIAKMENSAFMFVGSLLFLLGLLFLYATTNSWIRWPEMSPLTLYIVALSFYITYLIDKKHPDGILITSIVIGIISLLSLFVLGLVFNTTLYFSLALILSGILIALHSFVKLETKPQKKRK